MLLSASSLHLGIQMGGDLIKRHVIKFKLSESPPAETIEYNGLPMGGKADAAPNSAIISSFLKTPWTSKLCGAIYGGVGFHFLMRHFLQINGHLGMTALNEEYFSFPLYGGLECMVGLYLNPYIIAGFSGGLELAGYQTHKISATMEDNSSRNYDADPTKRFQNLTGCVRYFVGPFVGWQVTPAWRLIGRVHIAPFFQKEEKAQQKYHTPDMSIEARHTLYYGGFRATIGLEWMKRFP